MALKVVGQYTERLSSASHLAHRLSGIGLQGRVARQQPVGRGERLARLPQCRPERRADLRVDVVDEPLGAWQRLAQVACKMVQRDLLQLCRERANGSLELDERRLLGRKLRRARRPIYLRALYGEEVESQIELMRHQTGWPKLCAHPRRDPRIDETSAALAAARRGSETRPA